MLAVTQDAALAIRGIVQASELPDDSGLRITVADARDGHAALSLDLARAPAADDQVVPTDGAPVFLEADAADILDEMVLDAEIVGDRISFSIVDRD